MAANVGSQTVTLLYGNRADSRVINRRFEDVRKTGIYTGGYLTVVDSLHARLSVLTCEISDGTYQVKMSTGTTVTIAVAQATPYIVLRWTYTGSSTNDFVDFQIVASPSANDLVVGKCTFTGGGDLQGFVYSERSTPSVQDLFLRVEPTEDTELRVRVRAGRIQNAGETIDIPDQKTSLFTPPVSNPRIDLVHVDKASGVLGYVSGTEAASPVAPNYAGRVVLAEVTLQTSSTDITADMIRDVRNFVGPTIQGNDSSIEYDSNGKLQVKNKGIVEANLADALITALSRPMGTTTTTDSVGSLLAATSIYKAQVDGFLMVVQAGGSDVQVKIGTTNPPTLLVGRHTWTTSTTYGQIMVPVPKDHYVQVTGTIAGSAPLVWQALGTGGLVKQ